MANKQVALRNNQVVLHLTTDEIVKGHFVKRLFILGGNINNGCEMSHTVFDFPVVVQWTTMDVFEKACPAHTSEPLGICSFLCTVCII